MILVKEFVERRKTIIQSLPKDAIAVIPGANVQSRNADVDYPFRQNSDFLYLTGFEEADCVLVLTGGLKGQAILFCQPSSILTEIWTGPLLGPEQAKINLGVDEAYPMSQFQEILVQLLQGKTAVHYPFLQAGNWEKSLFAAWKTARGQRREDKCLQSAFVDLTPMLAEMRLFKSSAELNCLQQAIDWSVDAHLKVMRSVKQCHYEYQLLANFQYELNRHGCTQMAYPAIIASGNNACILHYTHYNRKWQSDDLLLIDAGGEHLGYAADLTRTYPVSGQWSSAQSAIYELVLEAQRQAILLIKPGVPWPSIQQQVIKVLTQGLIDLGILSGSLDGLIEQFAYKDFYMHNSGHWLGLDVHDAGAYVQDKRPRLLAPGMVLTVEPGLYFSPRFTQIDAKWQGIGVRIEDDIVVTDDGCRVMSQALPKTREDIKVVMADG